MKVLRYVLATSLLVLACLTFALADGSTTVMTVDGIGYSSVSDAASHFHAGADVHVVSDCTFDTLYTTSSGMTFTVDPGVNLTLDSVGFNLSNSTANIYGNMLRTGTSEYGAISVQGTSTLNLYGGILGSYSSNVGILCSTSGSGLVRVFGGTITGFTESIKCTTSWPGQVIIYSGSFVPNLGSYSQITIAGASDYNDGVVSFGPLNSISQLVAAAVQWITLVCAAIVSNKILLFFFIFVFIGTGIGLCKRLVD